MVKTLHFHCRVTGSVPGQVTKIPQAAWCAPAPPPQKKSKMLRHHDVGAGRRSTASQRRLPVQGDGLEGARKPPWSPLGGHHLPDAMWHLTAVGSGLQA